MAEADIAAAETTVLTTVEQLKQREFTPKPELAKCARCDVTLMCNAAMVK